MTTEYDPPEGGDYYEDYPYHRRGVSLVGILMIGVLAVLSFYVALITTSPLYAIVLPGNETIFPYVQEHLPGVVNADDKPAADSIEERINILFLGLDRRIDEREDDAYRTDSVMVITIDPFSKTAGAFSIPRDTRVEIPDPDGGIWGETRINEAYEMGEYGINYYSSYPGGGAGLAMDTVEHNFGIPIDHYILMDWTDFIGIIDRLGGVDIDVPEYAYDPAYTTCAYCGDVYSVEFFPGPKHMDGERALAYARIRKSDNDFKRVERQQLVLRAMAQKAASLETFINDPIGLYNEFKDAVQTDISALRAGGLALLMKQVGTGNIRTVSMAPALYDCPYSICEAAAELLYDPAIVELLKAQVFSDSQLLNENATVAVLNCTPTPGLAGEFSRVLQINGISSSQITTDEYVNNLLYDTTLVIDRTGASEHTLQAVASWLGVPSTHVISATDPQAAQFLEGVTSDIVVVLGNDVEIDFNGDFNVTPTATDFQ